MIASDATTLGNGSMKLIKSSNGHGNGHANGHTNGHTNGLHLTNGLYTDDDFEEPETYVLKGVCGVCVSVRTYVRACFVITLQQSIIPCVSISLGVAFRVHAERLDS